MAQFDYTLRPVDFVGQYMRGATFKQAREDAERRKAKEAELEALREGERREKAMVQDARQLKYLIESGDIRRAQDLAIGRLQTLTDSGLDTRDTEQVVGRIMQGDFQGALNDVNGFLSRYGELEARKDGPKVGRFRTQSVGDKVVMFDSATGESVKEWQKPKTEKERQEIRKVKAQADKAETEAAMKAITAETEAEKRSAQLEMAGEAARVAENILNHPSFNAAVGTLQPIMPTFRAETQDVINEALRLESLLTVDNLKLMSGVLTDRDIKFLTRVGSGLNIDEGGIRGSESAVRNRLTEIVKRLRSVTPEEESEDKPLAGFEGFSAKRVN